MTDQVKSTDKKIVWLASYPKSGNTWTRLFLTSYIADQDEFDPNEALKGSMHDASRSLMKKTIGVDTQGLDNRVISGMRAGYLAKLAESGPADILIKSHVANAFWNGVPMIPPALTRAAIYIVRHPFDVAVSFAKHMHFSVDEAIEAMNNPDFKLGSDKQVPQPMSSWSKHVMSWLETNQFPRICLRYEDMHRYPGLVFNNVLGMMRLATNSERLSKSLKQVAFRRMQKIEAEHGFNEKPTNGMEVFFAEGKIGTWREVLSKDQIQRLWRDHEQAMTLLGYGPDGEY